MYKLGIYRKTGWEEEEDRTERAVNIFKDDQEGILGLFCMSPKMKIKPWIEYRVSQVSNKYDYKATWPVSQGRFLQQRVKREAR